MNKKYFIYGLIAVLVGLAVLLSELPDDKFHIYFFDVGQGDSIFIKTPDNHQILIDGGPGNTVIERLGEVMPYFDKSLDLVVLTHPHADHVDGLVEVLKRYKVENVLITGVADDYAGYTEFLSEVNDFGIQVHIAKADEDFLFKNVMLDVVYPLKSIAGEGFENLNNSSIAIRVLYKDHAIMLSGDLESEFEQEIVDSGEELKSDIFKAGHHGSKTANSSLLLSRVLPSTVVIQCGKDNSFGHPHKEAMEKFAEADVEKIFRNDLDGTVEFVY